MQHTIELAADMDAIIGDAVASGEYSCAADAICDALAIWSERRRNFGYTLDELRAITSAARPDSARRLSDEEVRSAAALHLKAMQRRGSPPSARADGANRLARAASA